MAKPKLCLIPATIGDKVYSILPSDGVGDFDFTRASTATRINAQGLIETVASGENRLNYSLLDGKVVGCPSLLLEPQRTNNFIQSNQFDTSWNIPTGLTLTGNQLSPLSGGLDAWKLESDGSNGFLAINQGTSVTGTNTFSIYAKAGTNRYLSLRGLSGLDTRAQFDLQNGEIYGSNNVVSVNMDYIKDGWYRCSLTFNASNSLFYMYPTIQGTAEAGYIYIQNSQLEGGSFETSYIPTTTSTATRAAETCNNSGDVNTFNDSEGVLMAEISALADDGTNRRISISNGTTSDDNRINLMYTATSNAITINYKASGTTRVSFTYVLNDVTYYNKLLMLYKSGDFRFYVNGFKLDTDNNTTMIADGILSELAFEDATNSFPFYGKTKQLQYFDTALSDTELEQLTSWDSFRDMAQAQLYSIQ